MKNRQLVAVLSLLAVVPLTLSAQTGSGGGMGGSIGGGTGGVGRAVIARNCDNGVATSLGFAFGYRVAYGTGQTAPAMTSDVVVSGEPHVMSVDENGAAAGKLREGDLISRVNGYPITSVEGRQAVQNAKPGESIIVTVRRGDDLIPVTIVPTSMRCNTINGGSFGSGNVVAGVITQSGRATPSQGVVTMVPSAVIGSYTSGVGAGSGSGGGFGRSAGAGVSGVYVSPYTRTEVNPGWLGIGFDCTECGQRITTGGRVWYFSEPPVIYNVDTGSPAYNAGIRRGDLLVRVDGRDVTTSTAGARLGEVKPGETLKLTYKRAGKVKDTSLRVAQSPVVVGALSATSRVATELMRSTAELRSATSETRARELQKELEHSKTARDAAALALENSLRQGKTGSNPDALDLLNKLRALDASQLKTQQSVLSEIVRSQQEAARTVNLIQEQARKTTEQSGDLSTRALTVTLDSVSGYMRPSLRDQRLRYSGSIGSSDVEVRGPGSVSVQHDGDDLVIITSDAVIRVKNRGKDGHD